MAITKIVTVKDIEQKESAKGNIFLSVVLTDEKGKDSTFSIFDQTQWELFEEGIALQIEIEKKGNYWNIVQVERVADKLPSQKTESKVVPIATSARGASTNDSIEAQVAFKGIIELMVAKIITSDHPIAEIALKWATKRLGGDYEIQKPVEIVENEEKGAIEVTVDQVIEELRKLKDQGTWTVSGQMIPRLAKLGAVGKTVRPMIESLSKENLIKFYDQVKEAIK